MPALLGKTSLNKKETFSFMHCQIISPPPQGNVRKNFSLSRMCSQYSNCHGVCASQLPATNPSIFPRYIVTNLEREKIPVQFIDPHSIQVCQCLSPSLHPIVKYQSKWSRPPIIFKPDVCFATLLTLTKVQLVLSPVTPVSEEPDSKRTPGICRSLNRPTRFTVFSIFTSL